MGSTEMHGGVAYYTLSSADRVVNHTLPICGGTRTRPRSFLSTIRGQRIVVASLA